MNEQLKPDDSKVELLNSFPAHTALVELAGLSPDERMTQTRRLETGELIPVQIL